MKITIVTDIDPHNQTVGGIFNYVNYLCKNLKKNNFHIEIIGRTRGNKKTKLIPYDKFFGIKSGSNYTFLFKLLKFFFIKNNSDVIFSQRADFMLPFIFKKGKKVVVYHGTPFLEMSHKKGFLTSRIFNLLEMITLKSCDRIIVVSSKTKGYLSKYSLGSKIVNIPVGVDINIFKPKDKKKARKKYGFKFNDKIALYVGRFSVEKQIDFIVDEIKKLQNVKLILVGDGNLKFKTNKNIKVFKPVPHKELVEIINCADCLVLFSKYEGMPTVVLEALACGVPVVSSEVGDIKNVVINNKTGFLADRNNFVELVNKVIANPLKYRSGCIKMAQNYSWDKIAEKTIKVLA